MFFSAIDQAKLASDAGIKLPSSTLLIFGNHPLGIQFLTSNPDAGLDWPVRLLVTQDAEGQVWAVYTDFGWIARRHHIKDRDGAFKMASKVIASITSSVAAINFMQRGRPACDRSRFSMETLSMAGRSKSTAQRVRRKDRHYHRLDQRHWSWNRALPGGRRHECRLERI
jgi:uncharacterized protein (DUF302 family)